MTAEDKPHVADAGRCVKLGCPVKSAPKEESSLGHQEPSLSQKEPFTGQIHHSWELVYNPSNADIDVSYLLDQSAPWNRCANVMSFNLPRMIGYEPQPFGTAFRPFEKQHIFAEIGRHMQENGLGGSHSSVPCISFTGNSIELCCKDYDVAQKLWSSPPKFSGLPMTVTAKAFDSDHTAAFHFTRLPRHSETSFEEHVKEYASSLPDHFNTADMIVIAQFYSYEYSTVDEQVFTGDACILIGLHEELKKGKNTPRSLPSSRSILLRSSTLLHDLDYVLRPCLDYRFTCHTQRVVRRFHSRASPTSAETNSSFRRTRGKDEKVKRV